MYITEIERGCRQHQFGSDIVNYWASLKAVMILLYEMARISFVAEQFPASELGISPVELVLTDLSPKCRVASID
jgi:hypothetical protein